jgi:hypothetical protein
MKTAGTSARGIAPILQLIAASVFVATELSAQWNLCTNNNQQTCAGSAVGISTTTPSQLLDVNGASIFRNNMYFGAGTTGDYGIISWASGTPTRFIIYANAGKGLSLGTNAVTDRLFIDTSGNVGIGTVSPQRNLALVGSGAATLQIAADSIQGSSASRGFQFQQIGADSYLINEEAGALSLWTSANQRMTIGSSGNVGIGTTSPTQKLDVRGGYIVASDSPAASYNAFMQGSAAYAYFGTTTGGDVALGNANNYSSVVIKNGGLVGIGTTAPSSPLHVATNGQGYIGKFQTFDATNGNTGRVVVQTGSAQGSMELTVVNDNTFSGGAYGILATGKSTPTTLLYAALDHRFLVGAVEAMRISSNNNVGIGTTTPQAKLNLYDGSGNAADLLRIEGIGNAPLYGLTINGAAGPTAAIRANYTNPANTTATELKLYTNPIGGNNNLQQRVVIDGAGNVGIGTPTPAYTLDVNGSIRATSVIGAVYQDVAEWVPTDEQLIPGTVVVLDPTQNNHVVTSSRGYDTFVAGVVSAKPGIVLGQEGIGKATIATTGRVRVRVDASRQPIRIGDLLVTGDKPGTAMRSEPMVVNGRSFHQPGTILGKALEPLDHGEGEILVLLTLQ